MLHVDINKSHVNIIMLHVDIIYLACRGQKYATIPYRLKSLIILLSLPGFAILSIIKYFVDQPIMTILHQTYKIYPQSLSVLL